MDVVAGNVRQALPKRGGAAEVVQRRGLVLGNRIAVCCQSRVDHARHVM